MAPERPERQSAPRATGALPWRRETSPPRMQPSAPTAMTANEIPGMPVNGRKEARSVRATRTGTTVQKAYSSHIWPKYPQAEARNFLTLKADSTFSLAGAAALSAASRGRLAGRNGPSPSLRIIRPPATASAEDASTTDCHGRPAPSSRRR
ncbi:hypothetical protein D9M69_630090 [compost metagenome]